MRRLALWVATIGFALAWFRVEVLGIDILMDAVGWLLVWNGVRALRRLELGTKGPLPALLLIFVCAADMFFGGVVGLVLACVRAVLEIWFLWAFLPALAKYPGVPKKVFAPGACAALAVVGSIGALLLPLRVVWDASFILTASQILHIMLLLWLVFAASTVRDPA